jgi:hypothetical protein
VSAPKLCTTCGTLYPADERFCPRDGTALRAQGNESELVGSIIADRYLVIRKLGEGGMGQVYLAEHVKMGRKSAVKVMNPRMVNDADAISRFNREAANASRITHQHVAAVYDFGETPEGLIYLAMEYVEGEPLTDIVQRDGALAPERAGEIVRQAGEGLAVAHDMGIVHRDLKPDNIMIAKHRDGSDFVKVVDFGIAKAADVEAQKVTRTGLVIGTPEYMSPEQIAGDPLDGRSDIYSLGLVAFNILAGRLPFPSKTAQESIILRLTDPPKRLAEMRPEIPWSPAVEAVMVKALQRDRAMRYQSAREFGNALHAAVQGLPATGRSGSTKVLEDPAAWVPPTRVSETTGASDQGEGGRLKLRVIAAVGAIVIALAIAGAMLASYHGSTSGTEAERLRTSGAVGSSVPDASPIPANPARNDSSAAGTRATPSESARSRGVGSETQMAPRSSPGSGTNVATRIPVLLEQSMEDATAESARREAVSLLARATGSQVVGLKLVQARAYGMREDSARACTILRDIKDPSKGTEYETKVMRLLESGC